jgi:hypothetical protein
MKKILILGAGCFGRRAAEVLQSENSEITLVDHDSRALQTLAGKGYVLLCGEAAAILGSELKPEDFDYIVPAVPIHVAYAWLLEQLRKTGRHCRPIPVPENLAVPNPYYLQGTMYASLANHLCPGDCPEPQGYCMLTGEKRDLPLYQDLKQIKQFGFTVAVVQSRQLAPGVGGIAGGDFALLRRQVCPAGKFLVATSCSCHAVISAFTCDK